MAGLDSNVKLLLHFDGADGSTSTTDASDSAHVITPIADAQIDTAQSKFGSSSGLYDGLSDNYEAADSTDWDFLAVNTNPFTIDMWVRFSSVASNHGFVAQIGDVNNSWAFWWRQGTTKLRFNAKGSSMNHTWEGTWAPAADTWYHIACVRDASENHYLFVDGVELTLTTDSKQSARTALVAPLDIGGFQTAGNNAFMTGWIEELRISDVARWVSGFTPPTSEYSETITGDVAFTLPFPVVQGGSGATGQLTLPLLSMVLDEGDVGLPIITVLATGNPDPFATLGTATNTIPIPTVLGQSGFGNHVRITLPLNTVSAGQFIRGNISITLPRPTFNTVAEQGDVHNMDISLPVLNLNAFSGHPVGLTLPQFTIAAEGKNGYVGTFSKDLPRMTVNVKATQEEIVRFIKSLPQFSFNLSALQGIVSSSVGNRTLPLFNVNAHAFRGENGTATLTLPALTLTTEVALNPSGTVSKSLFMLTLDAYADVYTNRII